MEVALVALLEARMQLDLVDRRRHPGLADDPLEMVLVEVRDADRPDAAGIPELDQRLPRLDIFVLAGTGQWIRNMSICSIPSLCIVSSKARSAASR